MSRTRCPQSSGVRNPRLPRLCPVNAPRRPLRIPEIRSEFRDYSELGNPKPFPGRHESLPLIRRAVSRARAGGVVENTALSSAVMAGSAALVTATAPAYAELKSYAVVFAAIAFRFAVCGAAKALEASRSPSKQVYPQLLSSYEDAIWLVRLVLLHHPLSDSSADWEEHRREGISLSFPCAFFITCDPSSHCVAAAPVTALHVVPVRSLRSPTSAQALSLPRRRLSEHLLSSPTLPPTLRPGALPRVHTGCTPQ